MNIIDSFEKFEESRNALIESNGDLIQASIILRQNKTDLFESLNEADLIVYLDVINEGLKDKILNFIGDKLGGDISHIKTVLTQMKEQELKFNKEEYGIYKEFHSLLSKQKMLDKNRGADEYKDMAKTLQDAKQALNTRMRELTKTHEEIFNALEKNITSLTEKSSRKKKYFNIQRATDVLDTKLDRYNKIKEVTRMSKDDSNELEKFFGVNREAMEKDVDKARSSVKKAEEMLASDVNRISNGNADEPISFFNGRFDKIKKSKGKIKDAISKLDSLHSQIKDQMASEDNSPEELKKMQDLMVEIENYRNFLTKLKGEGKEDMIKVKG